MITVGVVVLVFVGLVVYWIVRERISARRTRIAGEERAYKIEPTPEAPAAPVAAPGITAAAEREVLRHLPILASFSEEQRELFLAEAGIGTYGAGREIFVEKEDAGNLCLLLHGRVGLLIELAGGKKLMVGVVRDGQLFAWSGLVGDHHYTATAHCMENSTVAILPAAAVRRACESYPHLGYALMEKLADTLADRLKDRDLQLVGLLGEAD